MGGEGTHTKLDNNLYIFFVYVRQPGVKVYNWVMHITLQISS